MPGAENDSHANPQVRSKFDKSQGRGLPAPHLSHPGEVAKETGYHHPGHNENGHKLPHEVSMQVGDSGKHQVTWHAPGGLGTGMADGKGYAKEPNIAATDHVVGKSHSVPFKHMTPFAHEPDSVRPGADLHNRQHDTRAGGLQGPKSDHERGYSNPHDKITNRSQKRDAGALAGDSGARKGYLGGRGKIK